MNARAVHEAEILNNVGLKATAPRLKVLQVFHAEERCHLAADDVHRRMMQARTGIGLATVYRVLNQLTDVGILLRHMFEPGIAVYELQRGKSHDHLVCLECGRIDEFSDDTIEQRQRSIAKSNGYALAQHELALYGYCPACRAKMQSAKRALPSAP